MPVVISKLPKSSNALLQLVTKIQAIPADQLIAQIGRAADNRAFASLELGGLLCRAEEDKVWAETNHDSFLAWCFECSGIEPRRSQYLRSAYRAVIGSGLEFADFEHVGWHKTAVLLPRVLKAISEDCDHATEAKVVAHNYDWLVKAMKLSRSELAAAIAESSTEPPPDQAKGTPVKLFKWEAKGDQIEAIDSAIKKVEQETGYKAAAVLDVMALQINTGGKLKVPTLEPR